MQKMNAWMNDYTYLGKYLFVGQQLVELSTLTATDSKDTISN